MLDIKNIQEKPEYYRQKLLTRNFDISEYDKLLDILQKRGASMYAAQTLKAQINLQSKNVQTAVNKQQLLQELKAQKTNYSMLEQEAKTLEQDAINILSKIPNIPLDIVPVGKDEEANLKVYEKSDLGKGKFQSQISHYEIGEMFDIIDFKRAVKLSGTRFIFYKNDGAKLVRAIQNYFLDFHSANGYEEYIVPVLVRPEMLFGTGNLPKFEEDLFKVSDSMYLIPTSEVSLTNVYNNEIIDLKKAVKFTAYSDCFRSEIGSGGKDNHGIIRMHQFRKVEIVKITSQEDGNAQFQEVLEELKQLLTTLDIPFQQLILSSGDMSFSSQLTYDFEIWLPSENRYREISSASWMAQFQARRAKIRYRNEKGETAFAHTINASGLAIDRLMAAILENNYEPKSQQIKIPNVLVKYFGKEYIKICK